MTTDGDFVELVGRMRAAQVAFFRRSFAALEHPNEEDRIRERVASLEECKRLEREVDRFLARERGPRAEPTLFDRMS